jgi:hypothetical protein
MELNTQDEDEQASMDHAMSVARRVKDSDDAIVLAACRTEFTSCIVRAGRRPRDLCPERGGIRTGVWELSFRRARNGGPAMKRFPLEARIAFLNLPQESSHIATNAPRWAEVFTPNDHQGALDPNRSVVVGDRGTGKSFWSSVLINQDIRNLVAKQYPRLRLDKIEGKLAFSDGGIAAHHPVSTEIATIAGR